MIKDLLRMSALQTNLTLKSDPKNVSKVEPLVDKVASHYKLSPDVQGNLLVSLTEAVTNAILHGNSGDRSKCVNICFQRKKNALAVRVSDEGPGFDPQGVPDPTSPELIDKCGGRGLFLMQQLSDECRFIQGGRTVELRFKIA